MKIGILTQPLYSNYGGLLQAWALQKTLIGMGHEAIIINRVQGKSNIPLWRRIARKIKHILLVYLGKRKNYIPVTEDLRIYSEKYILPFKKKRYLGTISPELKSNDELRKYIEKEVFDAYVVGSDQVWRPMYSPHIMTYFLDFLIDNRKVKKIAYAASFGVDYWEFSKHETECAQALAPLFDVITVRESSGIPLVETYLNCHASQVLDPTMLCCKEDYVELIKKTTCQLKKSPRGIFCYVLDKSPIIEEAIENCIETTGMLPFFCNSEKPITQLESDDDKTKCIVPPIEQWLNSFQKAELVITDSFHGTVFAIIFNKPFWVIINKERGAARFYSLLNQFGLEDRIIRNNENVDWRDDIDWTGVNYRWQSLAEYSKSLLQFYLQ